MSYSVLVSLLGILLLVVAIYDFYTTTMTLKGGGPVSRRLSYWLWLAFLRTQHLTKRKQLLSAAGPVILLAMIIVWFTLCWAGWVLFFVAVSLLW